jgi:fibronectin type 3 domain-containing protein
MIRVVRDSADKPETLSVEPTAADPGGANDHAARAGVEQRYAVYRSRVVTINHVALTLNSEPVSTTVAANALPPAPLPPRGIEAVVNTLGKPEIDLVWQASDQAGVAGYLVYRSQDAAAFVQITAQPTRAFSFADTDVQPGIHYRYRVVAVDANGAASQPSAEIERTIPAP